MAIKTKDEWKWYLLILPSFLIVFLILVYPALRTISMSFSNFSFLKRSHSISFVGLRNYVKILKDQEFVSSLVNTIQFASISVFLEVIIGISLALIVNREFKMRGVMRTTILFPWVLPTALNAIIWRWLFNTDFGFFNNILYSLGLANGKINWLDAIPSAMISMMAVSVWKTSSFIALITLTGLQTIPRDLYEAAKIDGTSKWKNFRYITFPLILPSVLISLLFRSMDAMRAFELPFALTNGGPAGSTQTLSLFGYRQFFQFLKWDTGSSVSVIQFLFIFLLGLLYIWIFRMRDT